MSKVLDLWAGMTATVLDFAGSTAPDGWLLCYGQAVSRTTYATLFAKIGTTYGAGDGTTTFTLPDGRGRVAAGKDNMGGTAAGRMTTGGGGVDGLTLGAVGGAQTHTLTIAQMPVHAHPLSQVWDVVSGNSGMSGGAGSSGFANKDTQNVGGGGAHPNVQPTLVLNKIIKT